MRVGKPWFREQTRSWYVQINGEQIPLGKHPTDQPQPKKEYGEWHPPKDILSAWHRRMAGEGVVPPRRDLTIAGLIEQFLTDCEKEVAPETADWYRRFLTDFAARFPKVKPAEIVPRHVRAWMAADHKRPWGQS